MNVPTIASPVETGDLASMCHIAGWFAGHRFGGHVTVDLTYTDEAEYGSDSLIAAHWVVSDGGEPVGMVHWHVDVEAQSGWTHSILLDEV